MGAGRSPGAGAGSLLGCRIVELVFPGSAEAGLHSRVSPEAFDDSSQLSSHHSLLGAPRQDKQLPGIVLRDRNTALGVQPQGPSPQQQVQHLPINLSVQSIQFSPQKSQSYLTLAARKGIFGEEAPCGVRCPAGHHPAGQQHILG